MTSSHRLIEKIDDLKLRHEELSLLLADPDVLSDRTQFPKLSKEFAELQPVISSYDRYLKIEAELDEANALIHEDDGELKALASETISDLTPILAQELHHLESLLVPANPDDSKNVFLEIRAGTGGSEAAIFAGDLLRMYLRYAVQEGWDTDCVSERIGEHGGYKEVVYRIGGQDVYAKLKFESGTHRVQRVPETESQGRIHTSACTVAILPEVDSIDAIDIDKTDLRMDTFRASGAGGQHVNKTDSAVRLTHVPTGIVVECQDERSQHRNRELAMVLLQAKILDIAQTEQRSEQARIRKSQVGSGDRSERIRTYNFPQGRITDHRINLTVYKLEEILEGSMDQIVEHLIRENRADQLRKFRDDTENEIVDS